MVSKGLHALMHFPHIVHCCSSYFSLCLNDLSTNSLADLPLATFSRITNPIFKELSNTSQKQMLCKNCKIPFNPMLLLLIRERPPGVCSPAGGSPAPSDSRDGLVSLFWICLFLPSMPSGSRTLDGRETRNPPVITTSLGLSLLQAALRLKTQDTLWGALTL